MPSPLSYHAGTYPKKPFKPLVKFLHENLKRGDIIAHTNPGTVAPLLYYLEGKEFTQRYFILPEYQDPYWRRNILEWKVPKGLSIPIIPPVDLSRSKNLSYKRVWLISSNWARDWNIDLHSLKVVEWMRGEYYPVEEKWMDGILVSLFVKRNQ